LAGVGTCSTLTKWKLFTVAARAALCETICAAESLLGPPRNRPRAACTGRITEADIQREMKR
jgi:hypothetical protein